MTTSTYAMTPCSSPDTISESSELSPGAAEIPENSQSMNDKDQEPYSPASEASLHIEAGVDGQGDKECPASLDHHLDTIDNIKPNEVIEISDDEDLEEPVRKRARTTQSKTSQDDGKEEIDPRKRFCIKDHAGVIQASCGDPRCLRSDCYVDDACKLWIYLPLMFASEPILWMVPVNRKDGGRLMFDSMRHLFHVAAAERVVYLTWRIGVGWVHFNWNEWRVLPGEDVILRPKHEEEISENRPGMKEVMQRLYSSMRHEGWTREKVPSRFR